MTVLSRTPGRPGPPELAARLDAVLGILRCGCRVAEVDAAHDAEACRAACHATLDAYFAGRGRRATP